MTNNPVVYSRALSLRICAQLQAGRTLKAICAEPGMPAAATVRCWVVDDRDGFAARYAAVKHSQGKCARVPYSRELVDEMCARLRTGRALSNICRDADMPPTTTVQRWLRINRDGLGRRYQQILEAVAHARVAAVVGEDGAGGENATTPQDHAPASRLVPRTVVYSRRLADHICDLLRAGYSLGAICRDPRLPNMRTVEIWVTRDRDGFAARYRDAQRCIPVSHVYSPAVAEEFCARMSIGRLVTDVCRDADMPGTTAVRRWVRRDRDGFAAPYRIARRLGQEAVMDLMREIVDVSRGGDVVRSEPHGDRRAVDPGNGARDWLSLWTMRSRLVRSLRHNTDK